MKNEYKIVFGKTRSKYYSKAIDFASKYSTYTYNGSESNPEHTTKFYDESLDDFFTLLDIVQHWNSSMFYVNNEHFTLHDLYLLRMYKNDIEKIIPESLSNLSKQTLHNRIEQIKQYRVKERNKIMKRYETFRPLRKFLYKMKRLLHPNATYTSGMITVGPALNIKTAADARREGIQGAQWSAVDDSCELCKFLDCMTISVDHPDFVRFVPPLHDGCKCIRVYISNGQTHVNFDWQTPPDDMIKKHMKG